MRPLHRWVKPTHPILAVCVIYLALLFIVYGDWWSLLSLLVLGFLAQYTISDPAEDRWELYDEWEISEGPVDERPMPW